MGGKRGDRGGSKQLTKERKMKATGDIKGTRKRKRAERFSAGHEKRSTV